VQLLLLLFWVDFIFLKNPKYGYNKSLYTHNGQNINVSAFRLSCQLTVAVSMALIMLGSFSPMKTPVMMAFTVISIIAIVFIAFCCGASFVDNGLCFFSFWRRKFWVLVGAFLESSDFNKEWFVKFKPSDFRYILQKPSMANSLKINLGLGKPSCFSPQSNRKIAYMDPG
jgi:hypothetical protein